MFYIVSVFIVSMFTMKHVYLVSMFTMSMFTAIDLVVFGCGKGMFYCFTTREFNLYAHAKANGIRCRIEVGFWYKVLAK